MSVKRRNKKFKHKCRCIISNEILEGKEAICKKNIPIYIEKQGQKIITKRR